MEIIIDIIKVLGLVWLSIQLIDLLKFIPNNLVKGILMLLDCPKCLSFWYGWIFIGFFEGILLSYIIYQLNKIPIVNKIMFR